ncbi:MAG TPA: L-tyrosine/L-tryptophan isonitrile synthase family protein [Patescibacteria group bacterium]|nr:L-tyrosine/L-tryptophan isonitrile synthase family protein [Patescibacteria group bacterium]
MKKLKANQYVYPYTPFYNLSHVKKKAVFTEGEIISLKSLNDLLSTLPELKVAITGNSIAEKILSIFAESEILFGPRKYIRENRNLWINKFNHFINTNSQIQMTILGFPFKMPISLKTNRTLPDMGEVLSLKRLNDIIQLVQSVYTPGAKITIITEGVFGSFNHISKDEYKNYREFLEFVVSEFGWNGNLEIIELEKMEELSSNFKKQFSNKVNSLKKLYLLKDKKFLGKYNGAEESIKRIINTKDLQVKENILFEVYNDKLSDSDISKEAIKVRKYIKDETHKMLLQYHAYLMVRDDLNFIENFIPHAITLTVSPKPNRLGIIPVSKNCIRLPYHGVPVYHEKIKDFTIEYLIDIERKNKTYKKMYWDKDKETRPFFYREV